MPGNVGCPNQPVTLFTDKDVKLHFSFERFLANQIRDNFGFIGSPIWFKTRPRNKKKTEE